MALTNTKLAVEEIESKTLYVGNLPQEVTELLLVDLFKNLGHVLNCKIIKDGVNDPYCFIEYEDYNSALSARSAMDGRNLLGKNLKVSWANSATNAPKVDTSKHYHIFVGDLNPDITTYKLKEAFIQFGEISDCRVVKDLQTSKSKGYGFVSFVYKEDAQNAINAMNGQWLGSRVIRTNWATRKPYTTSNHPSYTLSSGGGMYPTHKDDNPDNNNNEAPASYTSSTNGASHTTSLNHYPYQQATSNNYYNHKGQGYSSNYDNTPRPHRSMSRKPLDYNDVFNQASHLNTTVYCGGVRSGLSEQLIRETFYKFGDIVDLRVFAEKGFAFIKFLTKEAACRAIVDVNHTEIGGYVVRCSWGKENSEALTTLQALPSTYLTAGATGGGGGLQQFVNNGTSGALGLLHGAHQQQYYALAAQPGAAYLYAQPSALQGVPYYAAAAAAATHTNLNGPNGNTPNQQLGLPSLGAGAQHQMLAGNVFTNLNQHQFQQQLALQQHQLQCLTLGSNGPSPSQSTNFGAGPAYIYGSLTPQYESSSSCSFNNDMATGQNGNGGAATNRLPNHNNNNHHLHPSYPGNGGGGGGAGPNPNANNTNGLIPPSMAAIQGGGVGNIMTPAAGGYVRGTAILNPAAGAAAALVPSYLAGSLPLSLLSNHPAAGTSGPGLLGPSSLTAMPNYAYGYGYSPYWYAAASPTSPYATGPGMTQYVQPQAASLALPTPVNPQGLGILPTGWSPLQHQAHHVANTNQLQQASPLAPSSHNASAINNNNLTPNNGLNNQSMPPPQFATIQPYSAQ